MSTFDDLPPEVVEKIVEFLPFAEVHAEIKQVSKATRKVARRALTRGRWKPFRYVAEQGPRICVNEQCLRSDRPGAGSAGFREAWELDPALVVTLICDWDLGWIGVDTSNPLYNGLYHARFLSIVEPSAAGLSRVVSAFEGTYLIQSLALDESNGSNYRWRFFPFNLLQSYMRKIVELAGPPSDPFFSKAEPLIGIGLEAWAEPYLAARFAANWFGNETDNFWKAQLWSEDWKDRAKAIVFDGQLATIQEVTDSVHGRLTRSTPSAVAG